MKYKEHQLQSACIKWFKYQYPQILIWATPNGGYRNVREAARLRTEGVLAGVPDIFIAEAKNGYNGLFIELKVGKNTLTESQHKIREKLLLAGYQHFVCYSFDEFMNIVNLYIN